MSPEVLWILVAVIAARLVTGCLRLVAQQHATAIRRHDVTIEARLLRARFLRDAARARKS